MTTYNLTITRYEKNESYKEPTSEYHDRRSTLERQPFIETALNVSVSEEQFNVIRKAVLENWS